MEKMEIKSKRATFYVTTLAVARMQEDGTNKMVKEQYAVDAVSFGDAEAKTYDEMADSEESSVKDIRIAPYHELLTVDDDAEQHFYRCKVSEVTLNEVTGKERKAYTHFLVKARNTYQVERIVNELYAGMMKDETIESIVQTKILDIITND